METENHQPAETIVVTTDSMMPLASDNTETLQLCSPSQLMSTTTAMDTMKIVDEIEQTRAEEAHTYVLKQHDEIMGRKISKVLGMVHCIDL